MPPFVFVSFVKHCLGLQFCPVVLCFSSAIKKLNTIIIINDKKDQNPDTSSTISRCY